MNEVGDPGADSRRGIPPRTQSPGIRIPTDHLAPETLSAVIEEFVTRDGTDLVEGKAKIRQVEALLERGEVEIWFDEATRSCNILPT
jgi:uncharacterized protein YheU (UPF0270 family)